MSKLIFRGYVSIVFVLLASNLQAEEYLLSFERNCSTIGKELEFKCEKSEDLKHYIYKDTETWKAKTLEGYDQTVFRVLREDENILVLEQNTAYSGNQIVYIMKKNNQFYLVQVAYSNILKNNESTTKQGIYIKTKE
jgi:hypothetical protein